MATLLGVAWYAFVVSAKLDERAVLAHYEAQRHAVLSRDPEALCRLLGSKLQARVQTRMSGITETATVDKEQACELLRQQQLFFEDVGDKAGGMLTIEYEQQVRRIDLAANGKSATVEVVSTLKMGETFMQILSTSTERLERWLGRVQVVDMEVQNRVHWRPGALADPQKYFIAR
ncbi:hypothetical protein [Caldimonas brevitalea]|uniref:hypothetical protein n=1 Tax=Caldimonas brevitalea TaxID=413882 RepID=UPI0012FBE4D5|nr:hypothetical protein [Caldimonas brevitalea]